MFSRFLYIISCDNELTKINVFIVQCKYFFPFTKDRKRYMICLDTHTWMIHIIDNTNDMHEVRRVEKYDCMPKTWHGNTLIIFITFSYMIVGYWEQNVMCMRGGNKPYLKLLQVFNSPNKRVTKLSNKLVDWYWLSNNLNLSSNSACMWKVIEQKRLN